MDRETLKEMLWAVTCLEEEFAEHHRNDSGYNSDQARIYALMDRIRDAIADLEDPSF